MLNVACWIEHIFTKLRHLKVILPVCSGIRLIQCVWKVAVYLGYAT
jgi:hypothetical protein